MALEDKISTLPDDVLLTILSPLTPNEAVATSILSRRWRYLWTSLPNLKFSLEDFFQHDDRERRNYWQSRIPLEVYKGRFIQMLDQVLRSRKAKELQEFGIHCPLLESSSCHIDLWVAFGIAVGVSKLELNFSRSVYKVPAGSKNYSIPPDLFHKTKGMEHYLVRLDRVFSIPTSSLNVRNHYKSLRELSLKYVDLTDEHFEAILSRCTSLECLYLHKSLKLVNLKHTVPHKKLNCLEIYHCSNVEKVEIYAPNLVSFKYQGAKIHIFVKDAKQLANLCMRSYGGEMEYPAENFLGLPFIPGKDFVFVQFAEYLSQLEYLMMDVATFGGQPGFIKVPSLCNLKHLSLTGWNDFHGICGVVSCYHTVVLLVNASPFLHRLELHFVRRPPTSNPELRRIPVSPHKYLREVLVSGFYGNELLMDLLMSISDFAIELEKIEMTTAYLGDPSKPSLKPGIINPDDIRKSIGKLHEKLPANVQLCFLDD